MLRDPISCIATLAQYPSGGGICWEKNKSSSTAEFSWVSAASGEALSRSGVLLERWFYVKVPTGYHLWNCFLNSGGKLTKDTTSATEFRDNDFDAFTAVMQMDNLGNGIYCCKSGYKVGGSKDWWQGVAVIENNQYSINYDMDGGYWPHSSTSYHPRSATYDKAINIENPSRIGYTFAGWSASGINTSYAKYGASSSSCTTSWSTTSTKVSSTYFINLTSVYNGSVTFTANWTANTYSISYNLNGGTWKHPSTSYHPTSTTYNTVVNIENPTRAGYTFAGWSSGGSNFSSSAEWGYSSTLVTNSWNGTPIGPYFKNLSSTNNGSVTLTANWTPNTYTVNLNPNGGSGGSSSVTATYNSSLSTITIPSRTGYTFAGYYDTDASTGGNQYISSTGAGTKAWNVTEDFTLYARWTPKTYTVTLDGNGATTMGTTSVTATYGEFLPFVNVKLPLRKGYYFVGYYSNPTSGGTYYCNASGTPMNKWLQDSDGTIYARWGANSYTIAYNLNEGTFGAAHPTSANYDEVIEISNPTREGYNFVGWSASDYLDVSTARFGDSENPTTPWNNASTKVTATYFKNLKSDNVTTSAVTLTAHWQEKTWIDDESYYSASLSGQGTETSPYLITSAKDLAYLAKQSQTNTFAGKYFKQTADIDLKSHLWQPIGLNNSYAFAGNYNGEFYKIYNIRIDTTSNGVGLFGKTSNAKLTNISIQNMEVKGSVASVGAIVGFFNNNSLIANCVVDNITIQGTDQIGGVVGCAFYSEIKQCAVMRSELHGATNVGSILGDGYNSSLVDCNAVNIIITCTTGGVVCDNTATQGEITIASTYGSGTLNGTETKVMYGDSSAWTNWSLVPNVNGGLPVQKGLYHIGGFTSSQEVYNYLTGQGYTVQ